MEKKPISINFKSEHDAFLAEKSGIKQNTVRFTDDWTKERWDAYYYAEFVGITSNQTGEEFSRKISHKMTYKNLAIISWIHN